MKIERTLNIRGYKIKKDNIIIFAKKLHDEYRIDVENKKNRFAELSFTITSNDGTIYKSSNLKEIFIEKNYLENKYIKSVILEYRNYDTTKYISIHIRHASSGSTVEISSEDESWLNGLYQFFEDEINDWEKQPDWIFRYKYLVLPVLFLIISLSIFFIIRFLTFIILSNLVEDFTQKISEFSNAENFGLSTGFFTISSLFSINIVIYIWEKIKNLYPDIELIIGPKHFHNEKNKRKILGKILTTVFLPFIIGIITLIIGKYFY